MKKTAKVLVILISLFLPGFVVGEVDNPAKDLIIRADGDRFVDAAGRHVILRGANAGSRSKLPPFYPFDPKPDFETATPPFRPIAAIR